MEIIVITKEQLKAIVLECLEEYHSNQKDNSKQPEKYLYSIKELADFIHCSMATANKIKKSGKIRYSQIGRKILFRVDEIKEDIKTLKKKNF